MPSTKIRNSNIVDGTITSSKLTPSGITAGNYTNPSITVDSAGRVTSIQSTSTAGRGGSSGQTPYVGGFRNGVSAGGGAGSGGNLS